MSHVFISYSRQDQRYAQALVKALRKHGLDVWIDDRIDYGDEWWAEIVSAVQGCGAFVVIMSPSAAASKWVNREVGLADNANKPLFPLLLKGENWPIFVRTQYADVRGGELPPAEFFNRLAESVPQHRRRGALVTPPPIVLPPPSGASQAARAQTHRRRKGFGARLRWLVLRLALVVAILAAVLIYYYQDDDGSDDNRAPEPVDFADYIVFARHPPGEGPEVEAQSEIFAVRPDGSGLRQLTFNEHFDADPTWSPDRRYVAYKSVRDGQADIWVLDTRSGEERRITETDMEKWRLAWSPRGDTIAYTGIYEERSDIFIVGVEGGEPRNLTEPVGIEWAWGPSWSPDGERITFVRHEDGWNNEIYVLDVWSDDPHVENLSRHDAVDIWPAWSPHGDVILFWSDREDVFGLWVVGPDGGPVELFFETDEKYSMLSFSPDGDRVVVSNGDLVVIELESGRFYPVMETEDYEWIPDW